MLLEQSAAGVLEQPLHDGERLQFLRAEPQAGQFIGLGLRLALRTRNRRASASKTIGALSWSFSVFTARYSVAREHSSRAMRSSSGMGVRRELRIACSWKMRSNLSMLRRPRAGMR